MVVLFRLELMKKSHRRVYVGEVAIVKKLIKEREILIVYVELVCFLIVHGSKLIVPIRVVAEHDKVRIGVVILNNFDREQKDKDFQIFF